MNVHSEFCGLNDSFRRFVFTARDDATNQFPITGLTFVASDIQWSKPGVAYADSAGTVFELGLGDYAYTAAAAEVNVAGVNVLLAKKAGMRPYRVIVRVGGTIQTVSGSVGSVSGSVGSVTGSVGSVATGGITGSSLDATAISKIFDFVTEAGITFVQMFRVIHAVLTGKTTGGGTSTLSFRDKADTKNRLVASIDANNNRTTLTTYDGA